MSELRADTITGSDGTSPVTLTKQYAIKMWVNFNQGTQTARDSFNLSSLTDVDVGKTTVVMSSAMSDANYSGSYFNNASGGTSEYNFGNHYAGAFGNGVSASGRTTTNIVTASYNAAYVDSAQVDVTVVGDLA